MKDKKNSRLCPGCGENIISAADVVCRDCFDKQISKEELAGAKRAAKLAFAAEGGLELTIYRGSHQIGGTCIAIRSGASRILLDMGMPLYDKRGADMQDGLLDGKDPANPADIAELKRSDILPPIKGLYQDGKPEFDAILISHSHGDHYGLVHFAHPAIPLIISEGAKRMIETLNSFLPKKVNLANSIPAASGSKLRVGAFDIIPYFMDHSAFDARGFFITERASGKTLFYSGDFRAGGSKGATFEKLLANPPVKRVDYLLMEGTTIGRPAAEYKTEAAAEAALGEVLAEGHKLVLLACSCQNIDRIKSAYLMARKHGYELLVDPYGACVLDNIKGLYKSFVPRLGLPGIKAFLCNFLRTTPPSYSYVNKISEDPSGKFKHLIPLLGRNKISPLEMKREQKRIILVRDGIVPSLKRIPGIEKAFVIYSQWRGYLKKKTRLTEFLKHCGLLKEGVNFKYIHTSGHADIPTLQRLAGAFPSAKIIPVHTERPGDYADLFGRDRIVVIPDNT